MQVILEFVFKIMRLSILSFATSLCLSFLYLDSCFADKEQDSLDMFLNKIQHTILTLDTWYSNYSVHPREHPLGSLNSNPVQDLVFSNSSLQVSNSLYREQDGGGLGSRNCTIENMTAPIFFKNNFALRDGGGIYTNVNCTIVNNDQYICFDRNLADGVAGGIYARQALLFENNSQPIYFIGNFLGGIQALSLTIRDCHDILFFNNLGAGILIDKNGAVCDLSADNGDIIFFMNSKIIGPELYRCCIDFRTNGSLFLGAKKHRSIRCYDPILFNSSDNTKPVLFNKETDHQGSVIFSAQFIPVEETTIVNRHSVFPQPCQIKNGVVSVIDGAGLSLYQLTQDQGILCLGSNGVITTTARQGSNTTGCNIAISKLALDITTLTQKNARPPRIWIQPTATTTGSGDSAVTTYSEDTNPTITLSGDLLFLEKEGEDPYDLIDLSEPRNRVPLLYLWDNTTPKINITNLNLDGVNTQEHYGYQGKWTFTWLQQPLPEQDNKSIFGVNPNRTILYGDWSPHGYTPDPKYNTPLVANAIWESVYTLMPGMQSHSITTPLSGQLLGMVHVQNNGKDLPGFHMRAKAYWAEAQRSGSCNQKLSLNFGQSFSHIKEKRTSHKLSSKNYGTTLKVTTPMCHEFLSISTCLGYAFGTHTTAFHYPNNRSATGNFESHTIGASARINKPIVYSPSCLELSPFVEARCLHAFLSSFTEQTERKADARQFTTDHPFWDFTTPVGIYLKPLEAEPSYPHPTWSCSVAYLPTWYRKKPAIKTTKLVSQGSWISTGTRVSKHALSLSIASEMQPLPFLRTMCCYEGTFSTTTACNYMTLKGALTF